MILGRVRHLHFLGAGGVGMCGLAEIVLGEGLQVSGCDLGPSERTQRLEELGATIHIGHDPAHLEDVDVLVISSAVAAETPEVQAARERGIPVIRRAEMLAEVMRLRAGIAIAGTHGKTTTTSITGFLLTAAGLDPTVIVGGRVHLFEAHARLGHSQYLVCEADEYDRSFLELMPVWAVLTNLEAEHLDCYGTLEALEDAFVTFANRVPFYGSVTLCLDDPGLRRILPRLGGRRVMTYGFTPQAELRAIDLRQSTAGTSFEVHLADENLGRIELALPGRHNVQNLLAAIAIGLELELPFQTMVEAAASFSGVARRFELKGERDGVLVVDDYAHHPTELRATLEAARSRDPKRRLVAVFQPHLYSRTRDFSDDFGAALMAADVAVVLPIYPSREEPIEGVDRDLIVEAARRSGHRHLLRADSLEAAAILLEEICTDGDLVLTIGAGSVYRVGESYLGAAQ